MTRRRLRSLVSFAIVALGLAVWWATARLDGLPSAPDTAKPTTPTAAGGSPPASRDRAEIDHGDDTVAAPITDGWYEATVVVVQDGDSFVVQRADGGRTTIRIAGIDAPERNQPYADQSRRALRALLERRPLRIRAGKVDRYGREVSEVDAGGDVALAQIEAGLAWHFIRYAREQRPGLRTAYAGAEQRARAARLGLWQDAQPQAPWLFRDQQRANAAPPTPTPR